MKVLSNILIIIFIVGIVLCLIMIVLPLFILASPFLWIKERKFNQEYREYLQTLNGTNFFCYNNRKKGRQYIEGSIIPNLPKEVEILFLNGRKIEIGSDRFDPKYISKVLYEFENYTRFPHLFKVRNGEVIDCSINSELFNVINQGADENILYTRMHNFFELKRMQLEGNTE